jgi:hypothetical protein
MVTLYLMKRADCKSMQTMVKYRSNYDQTRSREIIQDLMLIYI